MPLVFQTCRECFCKACSHVTSGGLMVPRTHTCKHGCSQGLVSVLDQPTPTSVQLTCKLNSNQTLTAAVLLHIYHTILLGTMTCPATARHVAPCQHPAASASQNCGLLGYPDTTSVSQHEAPLQIITAAHWPKQPAGVSCEHCTCCFEPQKSLPAAAHAFVNRKSA